MGSVEQTVQVSSQLVLGPGGDFGILALSDFPVIPLTGVVIDDVHPGLDQSLVVCSDCELWLVIASVQFVAEDDVLGHVGYLLVEHLDKAQLRKLGRVINLVARRSDHQLHQWQFQG